MGSGTVADFHAMVFLYAPLKPASLFKVDSSIVSSIEGNGVSWPIFSATS